MSAARGGEGRPPDGGDHRGHGSQASPDPMSHVDQQHAAALVGAHACVRLVRGTSLGVLLRRTAHPPTACADHAQRVHPGRPEARKNSPGAAYGGTCSAGRGAVAVQGAGGQHTGADVPVSVVPGMAPQRARLRSSAQSMNQYAAPVVGQRVPNPPGSVRLRGGVQAVFAVCPAPVRARVAWTRQGAICACTVRGLWWEQMGTMGR